MRFLGRFILFILLLTLAAPILAAVFPDLSDTDRFWLASAGLGLGFWFTRKRQPKREEVTPPPPPKLEELERRQASVARLNWPHRPSAGSDPKGSPAKAMQMAGHRDDAALIGTKRVSSPLAAGEGHIAAPQSAFPGAFAAQSSKSAAPTPASSIRQGWVPRDESVTIAGRNIGGMVYIGTPPRLNGYGHGDKSRPWIDPSRSVAKTGDDVLGQAMPYWPGYSDLTPTCRATWLDWLASGRSDASYDPGYMFLYFYGLERRFIVDQPADDEKRVILAEVERLAALYGNNFSAQRYLGEFIQLARVALRDPVIFQPVFEFRGWDLPLGLKVAIGSKIAAGEPLGWDMALSWLVCHPEFTQRTPAIRCAEEFRALFRLRFETRFPEGLKVSKPRKALKLRYEAASSEFHADLAPEVDGKPVPDISGTRRPVEIAQEIAEEATSALDRFSRWLGRNPEGRGSIEAHALLPPELRTLFPAPELEALQAWAKDRIAGGGALPAGQAVARITGDMPERISRSQMADVANVMAGIGIGIAPDPRFGLRLPQPDEAMILFELGEASADLAAASPAYRAALMQMSLGAFVAQTDGEMVEAERQALLAQLDGNRELTALDHRILRANLDWLALVPPDLALLRRKLKEAGAGDQSSLRRTLIAAAHADGVIRPEEVAGIERLYKALGLDPALVYSDLHAGQPDAPVRVAAASPSGPGEAVPLEPAPDPATGRLDFSKISAIRADTTEVSSLLGQIFAGDSPEESAAADPATVLLDGLDAGSAALVLDLIKAPYFTEEAFAALCRSHGLMPEGALETINEWAFERWDEALVEAYEGYDVAAEIAAALREEIQRRDMNVQA